MTTDRKLLEAAARAAGLNVFWHEDLQRMVFFAGSAFRPTTWNPLTDDGDAFRLAVQLGMDLRRKTLPHAIYIEAVIDGFPSCMEAIADVRQACADPCSATRRAIVRAAAAMGEQK